MRVTRINGRLISMRQAAQILGVHHSTIARAVKSGALQAASFTPHGWKRFRESDILRLRNGHHAAADDQPRPASRAQRNLNRLCLAVDSAEKSVKKLRSRANGYLDNETQATLDQFDRIRSIIKSLQNDA